jgi:hypothetical protein
MTMAKGNGGKAKKIKVPKAVAGVKVPKALRKGAKKALKVAREPAISEVVAAAMLTAAAALREGGAAKREREEGNTGGGAASAVGEAVSDAGRQANKLGEALRVMAIDMARRTLDSFEKGGRSGGRGSGGQGS